MLENLREDLRLSCGRPVGLWRVPFQFLLLRGFRAACIYRMANWCHRRKLGVFAKALTHLNENLHGVAIHHNAEIGPGFVLPHGFGVVIGRGARIGRRAFIFNNTMISPRGDDSPVIGHNFVAYAGAQVIGRVTVGDHVTVGANAVVMVDVGDRTTVLPGRVIMLRKETPDGVSGTGGSP